MTDRSRPNRRAAAARRPFGAVAVLLLGITLLMAWHRPNDAPSHRAPAESRAAPTASAFQQALDSLHDRHGFPGATAAYAWADGRSGVAATGLADVEAGTPMTPETRMLAASIGKTFVAATAVALAEEGVLDLDAPIGRWLGDRPWFDRLPHHRRITLRHLLTHRSGLPDHVHTEAFAAAVSRRWKADGNPFPPDSLVAFVTGQPAVFAPGEGWAYSDTGYILVGLILEAATGRSYDDLVEERFLAPLRLTHTQPSNQRHLPGIATGYTADNPFGWPTRSVTGGDTLAWHPGIEWTGGGLVSTSGDLARWGAALFGGRALPDDALTRMLTATPIDPDASEVRYGMGVAIRRDGAVGPIYGHGGWIPGYTSSLRYYADHGVAIAFQINTDIGLTDDTPSVVAAVEARLAETVLESEQRSPVSNRTDRD